MTKKPNANKENIMKKFKLV